MLRPADDLNFLRGELGALGTLVIPYPALLAPIHDLEVGVTDSMRKLGEGRVSTVVLWWRIPTGNS